MTQGKNYHDKALDCAATAQGLSDPAERAAMLCIAQEYLSLAHFVDARNEQEQSSAEQGGEVG